MLTVLSAVVTDWLECRREYLERLPVMVGPYAGIRDAGKGVKVQLLTFLLNVGGRLNTSAALSPVVCGAVGNRSRSLLRDESNLCLCR
jgi:hypothetical protein